MVPGTFIGPTWIYLVGGDVWMVNQAAGRLKGYPSLSSRAATPCSSAFCTILELVWASINHVQVSLVKAEQDHLHAKVKELTQALEAASVAASEADAAVAQAAAEVCPLLPTFVPIICWVISHSLS